MDTLPKIVEPSPQRVEDKEKVGAKEEVEHHTMEVGHHKMEHQVIEEH